VTLPESGSLRMSRRLLWASLLLGSMLSLALSCRLAMQSLVLGSREGNWVYGYFGTFNGRLVEVFLIATVFAAGLLWVSWFLLPPTGPPPALKSIEWPLVFAWCLVGLVLQGMLRSLTPFSFRDIFASDGANSFYTVALRYDAGTILRDFDRLRPSWPLHAQSNLPGKLLLVRSLTHITSSPEGLAWLIVGISSLGGALLYLFTRDLFESRRVALLSLVLYLFMPAKLFFFPLLNTVTPVAVLACSCLLLRWLATGRPVYSALFGAAIYGLMLFEPGSLVAGLLFAALMARALWRGDIAAGALARQTGIGVATFAATYVAMAVWFGFGLAGALRGVGADAARFNLAAARPYGIWVRQNLIDFLFGVGVCQVVALPAALADGLVTKAPVHSRLTTPIVVVCLTVAGMLAAVDLIGVNRGEVIRLWIFLGCLFQIPAAYVCARLDSRAAAVLVVGTTLLQDALGSSMVGFIVP
jgi:hypothetical protein